MTMLEKIIAAVTVAAGILFLAVNVERYVNPDPAGIEDVVLDGSDG